MKTVGVTEITHTQPLRQYLAAVLGGAIIALATVVALSGKAEAVTTTRANWSRVDPLKVPADPRGVKVDCRDQGTVSGAYNPGRGFPNGFASIRMCLKYYRTPAGSYYYQGVLKLKYHELWSGASDVFAGRSMSVLASTRMATGIADCPSIPWSDGDVAWCYSPKQILKGRQKLYAKGYVIDPSAHGHPVWSHVTTTVAPPPPRQTSASYSAAMLRGFGDLSFGERRTAVNSGVKVPDGGIISVRFFIPNAAAAVGTLYGDARSWTADPAARSRFILTWELATGWVSATISPSRVSGDGRLIPALPIDRKHRCNDVKSTDFQARSTNQAFIGRQGAGLEFCVSALNSLTNRIRYATLSADGRLSITRSTRGRYAVTFSGNGYPAIEAYYYPRTSENPRTLFLRRVDPNFLGFVDPGGGLASDDHLDFLSCSVEGAGSLCRDTGHRYTTQPGDRADSKRPAIPFR